MVGNWRETGAHLVPCITLVGFVTVAYKFDQRILGSILMHSALAKTKNCGWEGSWKYSRPPSL